MRAPRLLLSSIVWPLKYSWEADKVFLMLFSSVGCLGVSPQRKPPGKLEQCKLKLDPNRNTGPQPVGLGPVCHQGLL